MVTARRARRWRRRVSRAARRFGCNARPYMTRAWVRANRNGPEHAHVSNFVEALSW